MTDQAATLLVTAALVLHGLGHGGAVGALIWIGRFPGTDTGRWRAAHSWAFPSLGPTNATVLAGAFWIAAALGFVAAGASFAGVGLPGVWRPAAVASALVSATGIVLFLGTWPVFNTLAALGMNALLLGALVWSTWPDGKAFGNG